jgi:carbonic anhydrase
MTKPLPASWQYADRVGDTVKLDITPARGFAILTCMDACLDPTRLAGLPGGDAHVIRNAGGHASNDAIRSLVISHELLGTQDWFVIHHTGCAVDRFTDNTVRDPLAHGLVSASGDGHLRAASTGGARVRARDVLDWRTIADVAECVMIDVERIRHHPLVPPSIAIHGHIFEVTTGRLIEVPRATVLGRARA